MQKTLEQLYNIEHFVEEKPAPELLKKLDQLLPLKNIENTE
jgi:hypothetical protein